MNPFKAIVSRIGAEFRLQRLGRKALREFQFRKYHVEPNEERVVRERLLRRLPRTVGTTCLGC
jgi:hypothetical protein